MKYYIGWDVGAWHCPETGKRSKDAIAIIDEERELVGKLWEGNLTKIYLKTVKEVKPECTSIFIEEIFSLCGAKAEYKKDASFCIAIDTPLGWTTSFRELLTMWSFGSYKELILKEMGSKNNNSILTRKTEQNFGESLSAIRDQKDLQLGDMDSKNNNPLLTRQTEHRFGESLSAIQDQIGSQSSKAMYLLSLLKPSRESTGVWKTTSQNLTIIETYPAPCMRSLAFIEHMKSIDLKTAKISSSDKFDALVCANLAWCFENPPTPTLQSIQIDSPPTENDPAEGWIFAPQENILDSNFGVSYPKLIGAKGLCELLSEIQINMVLSAIETAKEKAKKKAEEVKKAKAKEEKAKKKAEKVKNSKTKKPKSKTEIQEGEAKAKEAKESEDAKKEVRFNEQLNMVNQWANTNKQLFAHLNADYCEKIFRTLHPDWFKKGTNPQEGEEGEEGKKVKKDGKYYSEDNLAEFKRFLEITITRLKQGNP